MKTMVYTVEGFERFIEILEETNYLTVEGRVKVNEILENLIEREDFENASKLTKEWNEYKLLNNV
jgi:protein-arginine kinase activator protein McsA